MSNSKLRNIYSAMNAGDLSLANRLIDNLNVDLIEPQFINGYKSLKARLLIKENKLEKVINFYQNTTDLMSRDYIELIKYLDNISSELSYNYFQDKILDKIILKSKDVDELIKLNNTRILKSMVSKSFTTNMEGKNIDVKESYFEKKFIDSIINNICTKISNHKSIIKIISKISYKIVIDGGNLLYASKGRLNDNSYKNLLRFYDKITQPTLIVLHSRHRNKIKKFLHLCNKKVKIFYTPYNCNDDIYILLASLLKQVKIITNDKFGDHNVVFSSNDNLKKFLDEKIVSYTYMNSGFNLIKPKFSLVREMNGNILIPSKKGGFVII